VISFCFAEQEARDKKMKTQPRDHSNCSDERGLTLIESVIALLITVVGVVSLAGMFTLAMKTNASSRNLTTATTFAQDKLEQLGAVTFQRLVDPSRMHANPNRRGADDAFMVGSLEEDLRGSDGSYYFDKIILAGRDDVEPEGTMTVVRPDGTAETRRPDGTIYSGNPFSQERISYTRRWVILSSGEENLADRRLTIAVRVKSEYATAGRAPELVDLYTVLTNQ
jgi:type II secretory pathway pseudopilin PulG